MKTCERKNKCKNATDQQKCKKQCYKECKKIIKKCDSRTDLLSLGAHHSCAIIGADGEVKCWGFNDRGQLGDRTQTNRKTPVLTQNLGGSAVSISSGTYHTCAIISGGTDLRCWGMGLSGQLGDGKEKNRKVPTSVENLLGWNEKVVATSLGSGHTCAIISDGRLKCWGSGSSGQLGNGKPRSRNSPTSVINLGGTAVSISLGGYHSCALLRRSGDVKCWGSNLSGQLGDGSQFQFPQSTPVPVVNLGGPAVALSTGTGSYHTCAIVSDGDLKCWGNNDDGQLGDGSKTDKNSAVSVVNLGGPAVAVSTGRHHTCAIIGDGDLKCWGANEFGEIGDGTDTNRDTPTLVVNLGGKAVAVRCGLNHTCAVLSGGEIKCWGSNRYGQIGDGTKTQSLTPVYVTST